MRRNGHGNVDFRGGDVYRIAEGVVRDLLRGRNINEFDDRLGRTTADRMSREGSDEMTRRNRFNGLTDQIDWYCGLWSEVQKKGKRLSREQVEQLVDLRDKVTVFGIKGLIWAEMADSILRENGYVDDFEDIYRDDLEKAHGLSNEEILDLFSRY